MLAMSHRPPKIPCMFTGIIEKTARVIGVADGPKFRRLTLPSRWTDVQLGQSIAVNGVCLTVAELDAGEIGFDVILETLSKTNLGLLKAGDEVHVERSLCVGDRLDGHFVQGHVDGVARLIEQRSSDKEYRLRLQAPADLAKYLTPKGSVTVDGVSLTIAAVDGVEFEVALIPTTLQLTALGRRPAGWAFNLECDVLAKTVVSWLERSAGRE
jgi:riboflavin synthase